MRDKEREAGVKKHEKYSNNISFSSIDKKYRVILTTDREGRSFQRAVCWTVELTAKGGEGLDANLYSTDFFTTSSKGRKLKEKKETKKNRNEIRYYEMVDKQGEDTLQ